MAKILAIAALVLVLVVAWFVFKNKPSGTTEQTNPPSSLTQEVKTSQNCQVSFTPPASSNNWLWFERDTPETYSTLFTHQAGLVVGESADAIDSFNPASVYLSCAKNSEGLSTNTLLEKLTNTSGVNKIADTKLWDRNVIQVSDQNMANSNQTTTYIFATANYIYEVSSLGDIGDDNLSKEVEFILHNLEFP